MNDIPAILSLLQMMNDREASDLYLTSGSPPLLRVEDDLIQASSAPLDEEKIDEMLRSILVSRHLHEFETTKELNTSLDLAQYGRFRLNAFKQKRKAGMVIRRIVTDIPTFADLKLPECLKDMVMEKRGLVLMTGVTGSGKSTSLAAMINHRNHTAPGHIVTIEDPIEYYHEHARCVVTQREVGIDTDSYSLAMKNALRQRPDVILVGEVRDRDVMEHALMSVETGHLCLSTIHTKNAYQAIGRVVNLFPKDAARQILLSLSANLKAIVSQRLIPSIDGGLVPAIEIMRNEGLVSDLISSGHIEKIREVMEKNTSFGMQTFDQSLLKLLDDGLISEETAIANADRPSDLKVHLSNKSFSSDTTVVNAQEGPMTSNINEIEMYDEG